MRNHKLLRSPTLGTLKIITQNKNCLVLMLSGSKVMSSFTNLIIIAYYNLDKTSWRPLWSTNFGQNMSHSCWAALISSLAALPFAHYGWTILYIKNVSTVQTFSQYGLQMLHANLGDDETKFVGEEDKMLIKKST